MASLVSVINGTEQPELKKTTHFFCTKEHWWQLGNFDKHALSPKLLLSRADNAAADEGE